MSSSLRPRLRMVCIRSWRAGSAAGGPDGGLHGPACAGDCGHGPGITGDGEVRALAPGRCPSDPERPQLVVSGSVILMSVRWSGPGKKNLRRPRVTRPAELAALCQLVSDGTSVTRAARTLKDLSRRRLLRAPGARGRSFDHRRSWHRTGFRRNQPGCR